jgi:hypothetical protein
VTGWVTGRMAAWAAALLSAAILRQNCSALRDQPSTPKAVIDQEIICSRWLFESQVCVE